MPCFTHLASRFRPFLERPAPEAASRAPASICQSRMSLDPILVASPMYPVLVAQIRTAVGDMESPASYARYVFCQD